MSHSSSARRSSFSQERPSRGTVRVVIGGRPRPRPGPRPHGSGQVTTAGVSALIASTSHSSRYKDTKLIKTLETLGEDRETLCWGEIVYICSSFSTWRDSPTCYSLGCSPPWPALHLQGRRARYLYSQLILLSLVINVWEIT